MDRVMSNKKGFATYSQQFFQLTKKCFQTYLNPDTASITGQKRVSYSSGYQRVLRLKTQSQPFNTFGAALALLLLMVNWPALATDSKKADSWQHIARMARVALAHKDFKKALEGYQQAIAMIERRDPQSERLVNLKLMLAEVYRQQGNLVSATQILDKVEPSINNELFDPLLPARFWLRRADVDLTGRAYPKALSELQNSNRVLEKFFSPDSPMMAKCYIYLLGIACQTKQYPSVMDALSKLKRTSEKTRKQLGYDVMKEACANAAGTIHGLARDLIKDGNTAQSARVLKQFSETCPLPTHSASLWLYYLDETLNKGKLGEACIAIPSLNKLFEESEGMPRDLEAMRMEVECRIALNTLYSKLGNHQSDADAQWEYIRQIEEKIGKDTNGLDRYRGYQANSILFQSEFKDGQISDKGLAMVQAMNDFTVLPFLKQKFPEVDEEMKSHHISARLLLMHMSLVRNDPKRAIAALHSLNQKILREFHPKDKSIEFRMGKLAMWASQEFVEQKNLASAHQTALEAIKLVDSTPESADKAQTMVLLNKFLKLSEHPN